MDNKSLFYETPSTEVIHVAYQRVICASPLRGGSTLGGWNESVGSTGSNGLGGWTDNGGSAWD